MYEVRRLFLTDIYSRSYNDYAYIDRNSVFSSTSENNSVLQQAQRSLEANQKQLATVSPEPVPNVVPSAVQEIKGTSMH